MREKLKRELERINSAAGDREQISDHGINFSVTAWHITDTKLFGQGNHPNPLDAEFSTICFHDDQSRLQMGA